jgi:hypothetical protein
VIVERGKKERSFLPLKPDEGLRPKPKPNRITRREAQNDERARPFAWRHRPICYLCVSNNDDGASRPAVLPAPIGQAGTRTDLFQLIFIFMLAAR